MNQSEKRTRQRGKNFSPSEEIMLLQLLKPVKHIIDTKKSDAFSCQLKKDAWEYLAQEFTTQTGMPRTWRTLKDKYKNMNTKLKTEGRRMGESLVQPDPFETQVRSCVSVVYDDSDEEDTVMDFAKDNEGDDIELEMINETETIEEDPILGEAKIEPIVASNSRPLSLPSQNQLRNDSLQRSWKAEKLELVRLQQKFCRNENARAAKLHSLEVKSFTLKNQLLEMEIDERRKRIKVDNSAKGDKENIIDLD